MRRQVFAGLAAGVVWGNGVCSVVRSCDRYLLLVADRRWSGVMSLMARTVIVIADIWSFAMQVGPGPLPPLNSKK
jgi:hypothetical protein